MVENHKSKYKWELLVLLSFAFFTHQAGRAVLGVVLPQIKESLNITSNSDMGLVSSVLSVVLAFMIPLSGFMGDRLSRKWIITFTLIIGSAATALAGAAVGLITLILFYSVTSASCEALYAPSGYSLLASFHKNTRAIAMSIHQSALYIGVMTCGVLSGVIAEAWGWRWAFAAFGSFGVLLGFICIFRLKDVPHDIVHGDNVAKPTILESVKVLVTTPSAILLTLGFTSIVFVNNTYCTWAPLFVQNKFGLSLAKSGACVFTYHYLAALITIILGGLITDRIVSKDPYFRLKLQTFALLIGAPMIYMIGASSSVTGVWIFMAAYGVFRGLFEVNTHTSLFDVVAPRYRATAVGLMTMTGFLLGGTVGPLMVGKLMDHYGSEHGVVIGFRIMALTYVLGSIAMFISWKFTFKRDRIEEPTDMTGDLSAAQAIQD
ncbi:MAG: MFS transporter [Kiritimatiellae bacterium]|jgi:MFS family permease|nr:MFS transporter [Kiritimatiellia bacterium]